MRIARRARCAPRGCAPARACAAPRPARRGASLPWCSRIDFGDLVADREHRVERGHRLLEDHRDLGAADARASWRRARCARSSDVAAAAARNGDAARRRCGRRRVRPAASAPARSPTCPSPTRRRWPGSRRGRRGTTGRAPRPRCARRWRSGRRGRRTSTTRCGGHARCGGLGSGATAMRMAGSRVVGAGRGSQRKMAVCGASPPRAWPRYMPSVLKGMRQVAVRDRRRSGRRGRRSPAATASTTACAACASDWPA